MIRRYRVTVNGQSYDVSVEDADGAAGDHAVEASAPAVPERAGAAAAGVGAAAASAAAAPARTAPAHSPKAAAAAPAVAGTPITAPLPGVVLDVRVRLGQAVTAGDVVLILEAMKMENEITSPVDGTVAEVKASKGATVELGQVLVVIA
ncbi:MAG TPA: biotin/lipoyl-containing protein [Bacillota bacterium]|nr:biotin/lipoyl-containing protein [Bacillota bacterium]